MPPPRSPPPGHAPSASRSITDAQDSRLPGPRPLTLGGPQPPCSLHPLSALSPQVSMADPPARLCAYFCPVSSHPRPPGSECNLLSLPGGPVAPPRLCCWAWAHSSTRPVVPPPLQARRDCSGVWAPQGPSYPMPVVRPPSLSLQDPAPAPPWLGTAERLCPWEPGSWGGGVRGACLRLLEWGCPPAAALEAASAGPSLPGQTINATHQEAANVGSFILEAHADRAWRARHRQSCLRSVPLGWPGRLSISPAAGPTCPDGRPATPGCRLTAPQTGWACPGPLVRDGLRLLSHFGAEIVLLWIVSPW